MKSTGRTWLEACLVFLVVALVVHHALGTSVDLLEPDEYFHLRLAHLTQAGHGRVENFPFAAYSTWLSAWADSSYLYHLFLIPFLHEGDPLGSARPAIAVMAGCLSVVFWWILRRHGVPGTLFWLVLLWSSGNIFVSRMLRARALVPSVMLSLLMVHALVQRRRVLLAILAILYPLCYTAFHLPLCLWAVCAFAWLLAGEKPDWPSLVVLVAGIACGICLHPNFPRILTMWFYQNAAVLGYSWANHEWIGFANELAAFTTKQVLTSAFVPVLVQVVGVLVLALRRRPLAPDTLCIFLASLAFGGLTALSIRFVEYFAPFSLWYGALLVRDMVDPEEIRLSWRTQRAITVLAGFALSLLVGLLFLRNCRDLGETFARAASKDPEDAHRLTTWLEHHSPPNSIVASASFGEVSNLFYWSRHNRYLNFLDPMFFYQRDPCRFYLWRQVERGHLFDPVRALRDDLACPYIYIREEWPVLLAGLLRDPRVAVALRVKNATLLSLAPDPPLISQWLIAGQDAPAGAGDPGALIAWSRDPAAAVPASNWWRSYDSQRYGPTVALDRCLRQTAPAGRLFDPGARLPPPEEDPCTDLPEPLPIREAFALAELNAPRAESIRFQLGFSGELTVWWNGERLFHDLGPGGGSINRFTINATTRVGVNRMLVRCRTPFQAWGFSVATTPPVGSFRYPSTLAR